MNENILVLRGRIGTDVATKRFEGGRMVARFRLAATQWRRRDDGTFEDLKPRWYTVKVWERLAENVLRSVRKGEPLIVVGRPVAEAYTSKGGELVGELAVSAISVGHDLAYGCAVFEKPRRVEAVAPEGRASESSGSAQRSVPAGGAREGSAAGGSEQVPAPDAREPGARSALGAVQAMVDASRAGEPDPMVEP